MTARALALLVLAACGEHGSTPTFDGPGPDLDGGGGSGHVTMLVIAPSAGVNFGSVPVGATSAAVDVTVSASVSGSPQTVSALVSGATASSWAITGNQCLALMAPQDSCKLQLVFQPASAGAKTAQLEIVVGDAMATVALSGVGTQTASMTITPSVNDYGPVPSGTTSSRTFTLTNATGAQTGPLTVALTGAGASEFGKGTDTCTGSRVAAGNTCTVGVAFSPSSTGGKTASLEIGGMPGGIATASLLGTGVAASSSLTIAPAVFDFGSVGQGNSSLAKMFTVTNQGNTITGSLAVTMAGNHPGDFLKQGDQCNGHTLGPGAACTLFLTFEPGPVGARNARVQVSASPGGFTAADLSGTCTP